MQLQQLCQPWLAKDTAFVWPNLTIEHLSNQSKTTAANSLFFAYKTPLCDRADFIAEAIAHGAIAVLIDAERDGIAAIQHAHAVPVIPIAQLAQQYGLIAARFYGDPSKQMPVIGVTGTNGKSSAAYFVAQLLCLLDQPTAFVGTFGIGFPDDLTKSPLTTLDPILMQQRAAALRQQGAKVLAVEMSSHALDQNRLQGLDVTTAVLTQITSDHLDYHKTLVNYKAAKEKCMRLPTLKHAVLNLDDAEGRRWFDSYYKQYPILGFGYAELAAKDEQKLWGYLHIKSIAYHPQGFTVSVVFQQQAYTIATNLIGAFNVENIIAAIGAVLLQGFTMTDIIAVVDQLQGAPGRMESFALPNNTLVYVDYAHTTDGLQKALEAVRQHHQAPITVVFGCGGDRDNTKRAPMGAMAAQYANTIIVTSDNPRSENPQTIIEQIQQGVLEQGFAKSHLKAIIDRQQAIEYAIAHAPADSIILIAGKGHESTQQMNGFTIDCDDREIVKRFME